LNQRWPLYQTTESLEISSQSASINNHVETFLIQGSFVFLLSSEVEEIKRQPEATADLMETSAQEEDSSETDRFACRTTQSCSLM